MHPEALLNYNELMQQMLSTNALYLEVSVGIILFIGTLVAGLFYFLGIKPFQKKVRSTSKKILRLVDENKILLNEIEKVKSEVTEKLTTLENSSFNLNKDTNEKFETLALTQTNLLKEQKNIFEQKISDLSDQISKADMINTYSEHWMWELRKVPLNTIGTLIYALERSVERESNASLQGLFLDRLKQVITDCAEDLKNNKSFTQCCNRFEDIKDLLKEKHKLQAIEISELMNSLK